MKTRFEIAVESVVDDFATAFLVEIEQPVMEPMHFPEKRHTVSVRGPPRTGVTNIRPRSRETIFPQMRLD